MPRPGTQALVVSHTDKIVISALFASSLVGNNINICSLGSNSNKILYHVQMVKIKARANARNIVGQQDATLLGPTCYERLHTMLCVVACCCVLVRLVGSCWMSQQVPTFLLFRGHRRVVQKCCVRLHSTSNNVAPAHTHYKQRTEWYVWNCGYLCPRVLCILI